MKRQSLSPWAAISLSLTIAPIILEYLGSFASNLLANYLGDSLKPYKWWIGSVSIIALIAAVIAAVRKMSQLRNSSHDSIDGQLLRGTSSTEITVNGHRSVGAGIVEGSRIVTGNENILVENHYHTQPPASSVLLRSQGIGKETVGGWIYKVIKPLRSFLEDTSDDFLSEKIWTWRSPGYLEHIPSIREYIGLQTRDTLNQFAAHFPAIKDKIDLFDRQRSLLLQSCNRLFDALRESKELKHLVEQLRSDSSEFANSSETEIIETFTVYTVNRRRETGDFKLKSLWCKHRERFLALRNLPSIAPDSDALDQVGEQLLTTTQQLVELLTDAMTQLGERHDISY